MPPKAADGGGKGAGSKITEVDGDRLWRDRVHQELVYQRRWVEEFGFMVDTNSAGKRDVPLPTAQSVAAQSMAQGSTTSLSYAGMNSTTRGTYAHRPTLELKGDTHPHNRQKPPL